MTSAELQSVRLFIEQVEKLEGSRFHRNVLSKPTIRTMVTHKDGAPVARIVGVDEEELEAFLLRFRTLIRDADQISLRTIGGLFDKGSFSETSHLKFNQQRFFLTDWQQQVSLIQFPGEAKLTNEAILDTFLFGEYSHKNRALVKRLQNWKKNEAHFAYLKAGFIQSLKVALMSFSEIRKILEFELKADH
jgi:hypothetical protein